MKALGLIWVVTGCVLYGGSWRTAWEWQLYNGETQMGKIGKARQAGVEISPEDLRKFEEILWDWRDEYPNPEILEAGGIGETDRLAQKVLVWAREVRYVESV